MMLPAESVFNLPLLQRTNSNETFGAFLRDSERKLKKKKKKKKKLLSVTPGPSRTRLIWIVPGAGLGRV
jgi:hypothetical protein